jgi:undecaprenyl-diphosphatase
MGPLAGGGVEPPDAPRDAPPDLARVLAAGFLVSAVFFGISFWLTQRVLAGQLDAFDRAVLTWVRDHRQHWLKDRFLEVTALGGTAVLSLLGVTAVAYSLAVRRRGLALLFVLVFCGAAVLDFCYKQFVDRERPREFFAEGVVASSPAFPSGHSLMAAVVYLTCGFLLWGMAPSRSARAVVVVTAVALTLLVGVSRVYLGVHHPSDVLAGWTTGAAWAVTCFSLFRLWQRRGLVRLPAVERTA